MGKIILYGGIIVFLWILLKASARDSRAGRVSQKTCNLCGRRISINASVCPYCRRSVRTLGSFSDEMNYMKNSSMGFILKLLMPIVIGSLIIVAYLMYIGA